MFKQDQTAANIEAESSAIVDFILQFAPMVLAATAFYFRLVAKKKLTP